jgi:hypothetical protein
LCHPRARRVRGGAQHVHPPGGDFHRELHREASQADRVQMQKVAGEDAPWAAR